MEHLTVRPSEPSTRLSGAPAAAPRGRVWLATVLLVLAPHVVSAQVISGSYTGDGVNGRTIGQLSFQPDVVIVKGDTAQVGVIRTSTMAGDVTKPLTGATATAANLVESLTTTGFTIGTDARVNTNGLEYYWIAFKQGAKRLTVGTYTGNNVNGRSITGVGFSPEFVIVMAATAQEAVWRSSADTETFNFATSTGAGYISALGADGFTVTNDTRVNQSGVTYHYVAWNEVDGVMDVGSYTGDNADPRQITATTGQPEWVFLKHDGAQEAIHHPASLGQTVNLALPFTAAASSNDRIEALNETGFQIGNNVTVNITGQVYNYVAWRRVVSQTEIRTGTYTGNGADNRQITGLGFTPDLVLVKGDNTQNAVLRGYTISGDLAKDMVDGSVAADRIQSLDAEGFTVGTDARVNGNGVQYHWVAWAAGAGEMTFGLYTGNGVAGRQITDLGFSPDYVILTGGTNQPVARNSAGTTSSNFDGTSNAAWISALGADGFTVGNDARVNANGQPYGFVAWNEVAGVTDVGSYTGNGTDSRNITGVGFQPEYVIVQRNTTGFNPLHHPNSLGAGTDSSLFFDNQGAFANYIQALQADGFQLGNHVNVNENAATYSYVAWKRPTLTAVRMASASATRSEKGVTITWRTGYEVDNLGFDVYREVAGERTRVNSKLIAGSALFVPQGFTTVGRPYTWTDDSPAFDEKDLKDVTYWVEDLDLNGKRTLHGPILPLLQKTGEGSADSQLRDTAPRASSKPEPSAPSVAVNSTLLEELTTVEPQPRDASVSASAGSGHAAALESQARQPQGPIYTGWMAPTVDSRQPARPHGTTSAPASPGKATPQTTAAPLATAPAKATASASAPTASSTAPAANLTPTPAPAANSPRAAAPQQGQPQGQTTTAGGASQTKSSSTPQVTPPLSAGTVVTQAAPPPPPAGVRINRPPIVTTVAGIPRSTPSAQVLQQWAIASQPVVRVMVQTAGWYRLTQAALIAAGVNPAVNPRNLRLFTDGVERPLRYVGNENDSTLDPADAIEFYATGADTPFTDLRAYWIAVGTSAGLRLQTVDATGSGTPSGPSFPHTVERKDRTVFFAALQNGDDDNFFGPLVMDGLPTDQHLTLPDVHPAGTQAHVEVALQGVTDLPGADDHRVGVYVNGIELGEVVFDGRSAAVTSFPVAQSVLGSGLNTVSFEARGGSDDMTLVTCVRVTYLRAYLADGNQLTLDASGGQTLNIGGFSSNSINVIDITADMAVEQLQGTVVDDGGTWSMHFTVPGSGTRKLLVAATDVLGTPASVQADVPSTLNHAGQAGEVVMITDPSFASALAPLVSLRESQGHAVKVVDVQDVYDEFSFGQKTPVAIRDFLIRAADAWAKPPRFVLLVGNATSDPRNYQGLNEPDFVPTRIVSTGVLETASDDWFADADGDSFAELASVGRLPARSAGDVATMVDKIVGYEQPGAAEAWHNAVVLVSDQGDEDLTEFSTMNDGLSGLLPAGYDAHHIKRAEDPDPAATLRARFADGALILNYQGHGSVDIWRGDVLTAADVATLDNGSRLPLVVAMTCFNGFFHGLFPEESLAEALVRASGAGAVGVWASSGMTDARWQASMDRELFRQIFRGGWTSVGEAMKAAKLVVGDPDVRRSWIFFGDPAMRLKGISREPAVSTPPVTPAPEPPDPVEDESPENDPGAYRRAAHNAVRLADFSGDGRDDMLLAQPESGSWHSTVGLPGAFLYTSGQFAVTGEPLALRLNNDNLADLFVYNAQTGEWVQAMSTGDGHFLVSTGTWHAGLELVTGDLDGNGRDDIFARYSDSRWFQAFSDGDGYYTYRYGLGLGPGHLYAADFNADGRTDVFAYHATTGQWTMVFSQGGTGPTLTHGTWTPGWQPAIARLDNDNAADLVLWHAESGAWVLCVRDATQMFTYRTGTWAPGGRVHALDLNGDGREELLRYDWRTGEWTLGALDGSGVLQQWDGLWESGWEMTPGDLNADGRADLLLYNPDTGEWIRRLNLPTGWTDEASGLWSRNWTVTGRRR
jgi:hypothetical protein